MRATIAIDDESDPKRTGRGLPSLRYALRSGACMRTRALTIRSQADHFGTGAHGAYRRAGRLCLAVVSLRCAVGLP